MCIDGIDKFPVIHVFETVLLNALPAIKHGFPVTDVQLMTTKIPDKRYLALIDSSMNIFIVHVGHKDGVKTYKLGKHDDTAIFVSTRAAFD